MTNETKTARTRVFLIAAANRVSGTTVDRSSGATIPSDAGQNPRLANVSIAHAAKARA
jgi:hypothetical protein